MSGAVHRVAARVLPINARGEVLLLQGQDPARPGVLHWVSIGGAVEPGETLAEAGVREMLEETGLAVDQAELVGPVHRATHPFSWDGVAYVSDNHFFAVRLDATPEVHFAGLEEAEVGNILQARWWTPQDLRVDGTAVTPDLPEIMAAAVGELLEGTR
ncbi:NUDIX domain-containing protein [Nocardioides albidus]|uniref:NUDIX domain-containing protein n=1 Tax=Nocardioides albidus TaxID=1517589 RepID=A0A5C4W5H4_9ACTN|nr:NUDIX domain-containing protein [Nocardioides albidus]TNM43360.1 NUDIX domain-containing protein [Nocardioides albidus]